MAASSSPEEQITVLQQYEQQLHQTILQRQTLQSQLLETENALELLGKTQEQPFKMVGPLLVAVEKTDLTEELTMKKDTLQIRLNNVEQQEEQLQKKFQELQHKVMQQIQQQKKRQGE